MGLKSLKSLALGVMSSLILFTGCSDQNGAIDLNEGESQVSLHCNIGMKKSQTLSQRSTGNTSLTGELTIIDLENLDTLTEEWYVVLNNDLFTATSNKSIVLAPGVYDFQLTVSNGTKVYTGKSSGVLIADQSESMVDLTLSPVFGHQNITTDLSQLASLLFRYPQEEFAELDAPKIGIAIDGGSETIYDVNKATGLTELYFDLEAGLHTFQIKLYDGNTQVGRSINGIEQVDVILTEEVPVDLVPLHADVALTLPMKGGEATFTFTIPTEVVDEVGGITNLRAAMTVASGVNGPREQDIQFTANGAAFVATTQLTNYRYDAIDCQILFIDTKNGEIVGTALLNALNLSAENQSAVMELLLRRRSVVTGNILGTLGLNVFNSDKTPQIGVSVYANGTLVGITGENSFATPGYLKLYMKKGEYRLTARVGKNKGTATVAIAPLDVKNADITIDEQNLITNADATTGLDGWTVTANGGNGWAARSNTGATYPEGYTGHYATSYGWDRKNQIIDLVAAGYTAGKMDLSPEIEVSEYILSRGDCQGKYQMVVKLLAEDKTTVIAEYSSGTLLPARNVWTLHAHIFKGYGAGVRYISFEHAGVDSNWWAGHYGAYMTGASVVVK